MNEQRCVNCRFWEGDEKTIDGFIGFCRRFPPQCSSINREYNKLVDARRTPNSEWPETYESDWCGEWKAAEATEPETPTTKELLESLFSLGLSVRVRKMLKNYYPYSDETSPPKEILTVGDLIRLSADRLLEVKMCGHMALKEIREKLAAHGLKLKGD